MTTNTQAGWPTQTTFPGQAAAPDGPVDLVNMYLFHHAFRRDLTRFAAAVPRTPIDDVPAWERLSARWAVFARQLHHHHEAEDRVLWPWLRERATAQELGLLDAMEAEHGAIDPGLAQTRAAFAELAAPGGAREDTRAALVVRLAGVREILDQHLAHEETDAMAMLQRVTDEKDWAVIEKQLGQGQPAKALLELVPWAVDGLDDDQLRRLLRKAPPPMRVILRLTRGGFRRREAAAFAYVSEMRAS